jgi:hypothetical protein
MLSGTLFRAAQYMLSLRIKGWAGDVSDVKEDVA